MSRNESSNKIVKSFLLSNQSLEGIMIIRVLKPQFSFEQLKRIRFSRYLLQFLFIIFTAASKRTKRQHDLNTKKRKFRHEKYLKFYVKKILSFASQVRQHHADLVRAVGHGAREPEVAATHRPGCLSAITATSTPTVERGKTCTWSHRAQESLGKKP